MCGIIFSMRIAFLTLLIGLFFIGVTPAFAAIVPCDGVSSGGGKACQACHFVQLGNNILKWIIGIMASVCALVIAYAGFLMVMAGGDSGNISEAREMITNTVIGFIILLSAWLVVDTVLKMFVGDTLPGFGPWNKIECVLQPAGTTGGTEQPPATACANITPLTPLTDALALQMEAGQSVIWNNPTLRACANKFIGKVGGSVTSAFRPPDYQNHLWEINDKWCRQNLRSNTDAACSTLKSSIQSEVSKHGLGGCGAVARANNSTHGSGTGVDITGPAHGSPAVTTAANESCLIWRNYPNDPYHYDLKTGCTCN